MVKYLVVKVTSAIILALASATGYALDITQAANIGYKWWPFIALAFFVAIVIWIIADLYNVNSRLLNTKPEITVEPIKEGDVYLLKVTNIGEQAIFEAQISLAPEDPSVSPLSRKSHYQACWDNAEKYRANIPKDHSTSIKIAELHSSPPNFNILTWHLFYCDYNNQENYASTSSYFVGAYIVHEDGSKTPAKPTFEYKLHVVISSNPSLRNGTFQEDYIISYQRRLEQSITGTESA
jgi:hypothetical protein